jgi:hypothetical protein
MRLFRFLSVLGGLACAVNSPEALAEPPTNLPTTKEAIATAFGDFLKDYVKPNSAYPTCVDLPIAIPANVKTPGLRPISECTQDRQIAFIEGQPVPRHTCYISPWQSPGIANDNRAVQCTNFRNPPD